MEKWHHEDHADDEAVTLDGEMLWPVATMTRGSARLQIVPVNFVLWPVVSDGGAYRPMIGVEITREIAASIEWCYGEFAGGMPVDEDENVEAAGLPDTPASQEELEALERELKDFLPSDHGAHTARAIQPRSGTLPAWRTDPRVTCRDILELEPTTRKLIGRYLRDAKTVGFNVILTDTVRTKARQNWLYLQGRIKSRPGPIVTFTRDSNHLYRIAADILPVVQGKARYDLLGALYSRLPPAKYGLESLKWERSHLQRAGADKPGAWVAWHVHVAYP